LEKTKEDKGKSMIHALNILQRGMSWDKVLLSSEEIKPIALSIVELCLAEGISKLVS